MKVRRRHPIWNWIIHTPWVLTVIAILSVIVFFGSGAGNPLLSRLIVRRLQSMTGGKVEFRALSVQWMSMRVTIKGLVIHGKESAGTEPLLTANEVEARLRVDSFWGRKVSLEELFLREPHLHIRVDKTGSTNVPTPPRSSNKPVRDTLFALNIQRLQIEDGWIFYNDVMAPLVVKGGELKLSLDAGGTTEHPLYVGSLEWQTVQFTSKPYQPLPVSLSAKFTFWRDGFTLEQGMLNAGRSHLDAQAEMSNFAKPQWSFRYRGWTELLDFRETLRNPLVPTGRVDFRGEGQLADGKYKGGGTYSGYNIALPYTEFHTTGLTSHGSYKIDNRGLEIPDFFAGAFGGGVTGRVTMRFDGLQFRADTHVQNTRLSGVLPAIEHRGFPIDELHWDAMMTADTVETWTGAFEHFEISVKTAWNPPERTAERHQPVSAAWKFSYRFDPNILAIQSGEFETPLSHGTIDGVLAPRNSTLMMRLETSTLDSYKDFIDALRGAKPGSADAATPISGSATWDGKILGPSGKPAFQGHLRGERVRYDGVFLDYLDGD